MVERHRSWQRRDALLERFGGAPGRYAVLCVAIAVIWFLIDRVLDGDEPIAEHIADNGLRGATWALFPTALEWGERLRLRTPGAVPKLRIFTPADRPAWDRRGAIVGLGVGVPFFGAMIAFCQVTGQSWVYTMAFGVCLSATVVVAVRNLRDRER